MSSAAARKRMLLSALSGGPPEKKQATGSIISGVRTGTTTASSSSTASSRQPTQRETGKVESYDKQKGFGFIISDNPPEGAPAKVFVYHSHIKTTGGFRYLKEGAEVSFLRGQDKERDNLPCCLDVRHKDGKSLIDNDEGKVERKQMSFAMQNWQNVFQKYPTMKLETYYDRMPSNVQYHDDSIENVNIQYLGSLFGLYKARFGGDAVKFLKDRFAPSIDIRDPDEFEVPELFGEAAESCEKEYLPRSVAKRNGDGAEYAHLLFQHVTLEGRPFVNLHTSHIGSCVVLACDGLGRALRLNEPHLATPLTMRGSKFELEAGKEGRNLQYIKTGFHPDGGQASTECKLPSHRVFGARAFKKADPGLRLEHAPETKHCRTWALKSVDMVARNTSRSFPPNRPTFDYFVLLMSPELYKWFSDDQQIIDEALQAMKRGRSHGEGLSDSCAKGVLREALKKGAPETLSCMCIVPIWQTRMLEMFLDKLGQQAAQQDDDMDDMFAPLK
ncbi:unnamed protein product [Amoebophrya sp. A120]|nr:unnamed protein product [Amoebophrya sp. A120]|eukprot:GSA120T00005472001.1